MTMRRVGLRLPDGAHWTGGLNYIVNVCRALTTAPEGGFEPVVFAAPGMDHSLRAELSALLGERLVVLESVPQVRNGVGIAGALALGVNRRMANLCSEFHCDVMLEVADYLGWRFPVACLGWVPDFQDRYLPHLFPWMARFRRIAGVWAQIYSQRVILLSSEDARKDCSRFFSSPKLRTRVARFAVLPSLEPDEQDPTIHRRYGLPERFFYLPNQYWTHKNHVTVVDAIEIAARDGIDIVVASSGNPSDQRNLNHYAMLKEKVSSASLQDRFRFLGVVPSRDVALLMRASVAVINPSLFEGWSTTVEEAKSLGSRLVLSDLAVHHEQAASEADYFAPTDARNLATVLAAAWSKWSEPVSVEQRRAAAMSAGVRVAEFGRSFAAACHAARENAPSRYSR